MGFLEKARLGAEVFLVVLICILLWRSRSLEQARDQLISQNATLESNLKSSLTIANGKVVYKWRDRDNKVHSTVTYVPPEGGVTVKTPTDVTKGTGTPSTGNPIKDIINKVGDGITGIGTKTTTNPDTGEVVVVRRAGFCFRPALAGLLSLQLGPAIGIQARTVYFDRWGVGPGIGASLGRGSGEAAKSRYYGYGFIDRRVDDFLPLLRNTALGAHAGYSWETSEKVGGVNLSLFF